MFLISLIAAVSAISRVKHSFSRSIKHTTSVRELFGEIKKIWPIAYLGFAYSGFLFTVWAFLSLFAQHFAINLLGIGILYALFWCCRLVSFLFIDFLAFSYQRKCVLMAGACLTM
ncbi:MAG: hypothetical protein H0Z34_00345 [Brevibacillus sp.]|nr:hypothetical protein [Brevibacillus sp.]